MKYAADRQQFIDLLAQLSADIDAINGAHGFNDPDPNKAEMIALMHSELSECLEGLRHGNPPDSHCPEFSSEEVELADELIRIFHYMARFKLRLGEALFAKIDYNRSRPYKHGKVF